MEENIRLLSLATSPFFRGDDVSINAYVPLEKEGQKNSTVRIHFQNLPLNLMIFLKRLNLIDLPHVLFQVSQMVPTII